MKTVKFLNNTYIKGSLFVIAGVFIGWLIFHQSAHEPILDSNQTALHEHDEAENTIWTCAMHPQIRMDKPGKCPICGMELIPLKKSTADIDDQAIEMSESAIKLAEVQTSIVGSGIPSKELRLYGKIQADERRLQSQTAHVPGRIEQLFINVTGESVSKGQLISKIYSPELITAQKELLEAISLGDKYPNVLESAVEKLKNWKLSDEQIQEIERSGKVNAQFEIFANTSGIVTSLKVNQGDYVNKGAVLFDVADLSKVWVVFDAYESDLPWISLGQKVTFTTQAVPGKSFEGKITFIDPMIDPATRIAKTRIEVANSKMMLKPEMFVNGVITAGLNNEDQNMIIPQSAVLWTGTRSIVYVKLPGTDLPTFKLREITLGASMKDSFVVLDGLQNGEEIVTNGAFSIDAAAQLAGKPSMMNAEEGVVIKGHDHVMEAGMSQGNIQKEDASMVISPQIKKALSPLFSSYLILKDDLVDDDLEHAKQVGKQLLEEIKKIDMKLFEGSSHGLWMNEELNATEFLEKIIAASEIAQARIAFKPFSESMIRIAEVFKPYEKTLYVQHCPMADDNKGADWLSTEESIKNPYYGQSMLTCGEVTDTIKNN